MINKVFPSVADALSDLQDGATIMIGGFGGAGTPHNLVQGMIDRRVGGLTLICNGFNNILLVKDWRTIKKVVMSFPHAPGNRSLANPMAEGIELGAIEVETVPQGTLAERIRCGGAGIPAFYTPTGVGTRLSQGKERRAFYGRDCLLETALVADFAFIQAFKGDEMGNVIYRKTARNFNPLMATAAKIVIAEVQEIVPVGEIDGDQVHTPGIFVDRLVKVKPVVRAFRVNSR